MDDLIELVEKPVTAQAFMVVGWRQWADAGGVSSQLPRYLIEQLQARKIGEIKADGFYLFQLPGTQAFLRPEIKLADGYPRELEIKRNEIYFAGDARQGLYIVLGDEPHLQIGRYAEALFNLAAEFHVQRTVALGGVYGPVPFDKEREVSCTYSQRALKDELSKYAVRFSNYEGGASIGSYLAVPAAQRHVEYLAFYAFVPMYELSDLSPLLQALIIEEDHRAWYDVMRRVNHMFKLGIDLTDLQSKSRELTQSMSAKINDLSATLPQVNIQAHIAKLTADFTEPSFMPLDDVWETGLSDLFGDPDKA